MRPDRLKLDDCLPISLVAPTRAHDAHQQTSLRCSLHTPAVFGQPGRMRRRRRWQQQHKHDSDCDIDCTDHGSAYCSAHCQPGPVSKQSLGQQSGDTELVVDRCHQLQQFGLMVGRASRAWQQVDHARCRRTIQLHHRLHWRRRLSRQNRRPDRPDAGSGDQLREQERHRARRSEAAQSSGHSWCHPRVRRTESRSARHGLCGFSAGRHLQRKYCLDLLQECLSRQQSSEMAGLTGQAVLSSQGRQRQMDRRHQPADQEPQRTHDLREPRVHRDRRYEQGWQARCGHQLHRPRLHHQRRFR